MSEGSMKQLPRSDIYEQEFQYMPWGVLIDEVLDVVVAESPRGGRVLDLMCGPGYLLGKIRERRKDLTLTGVDINEEFIAFARSKYADIGFILSDVLHFQQETLYDLVICTAGIHHLPYSEQESFLERAASMLNRGGFYIFADPYISDYEHEEERRLAAAELGYEYLTAVLRKDAPKEIIQAVVDILFNDVMGYEYKTSLKKIKPVFEGIFSHVEVHKTWPKIASEYGEYYLVVRK